ncbi:MAG: FKBP-type peptidylprolyl isomerase [Alphaproteobacteria bacterium]|nr:FKBP-type peptidylprolyl isomerase [Alphaproteobacteria bacterium]MDF3034226.1 FKBP-type peptidylprolyl isomerase [Alphaproteobacteria bacterium]
MSQTITTASGLQYVDTVVGDGESPQKGQRVSVHYRGALEDGTSFDNSYDRGAPLQFMIGVGQVIAGFDEGLATMAVGGKRRLHIPAALGYGATGAGSTIPPHSNLIFDVELVSIG